jgi:small conductance mechanosensitive channel
VVIVGVFVAAWLLSRIGSQIAAWLVDHGEHRAIEGDDGRRIGALRQRETAISLTSTTIRYGVFALAFVLALATLAGAQRLQTIVGASFLAIIIGFAAQRFLMDVIAGLLMFFEGWFRIGDTVAIDALHAQGVVEAVSLRSLMLRSVTGELLFIPNSSVTALRVIPSGFRKVEVELFTSELGPGKALIEEIARIVPGGTTRFLERPAIADTEQLDDHLFRISARCAVAVGREWLAEDLLPSLIRQRAAEGLIAYGPIITFADEQAQRSFSRALMTPSSAHRGRLGRKPARAQRTTRSSTK